MELENRYWGEGAEPGTLRRGGRTVRMRTAVLHARDLGDVHI